MTTYLLFLVPMLLIGVGVMIFMQRMQKKAESKIDINALRANKEQISKELLQKEAPFLKEWMKDKQIDAYTSAVLPSTLGDVMKVALKNTLRKTLTYSNINEVETPAYFVISGNDLHFFNTDGSKNIEEHIIFDAFRLKESEIKFIGAKKEMGIDYSRFAGKYQPQVYNLTLGYKDGVTIIQAIDRLLIKSVELSPTKMLNGDYMEDVIKGRLVGEFFFETLGNKFPNLQVNLKH